MALTSLCLTFVVFFLTNLQPNLEKLAKTQANNRMTDDQVISWLARNGYDRNLFVRYGEWPVSYTHLTLPTILLV